VKTITLIFDECEHEGDLDSYIRDVRRSGGRILESRVDREEDQGIIRCEVHDPDAFRKAFCATESADFTGFH